MLAEVIAIGDEITSGQSLDTNTQWLSQRLEALGVHVLYHSTIGDELQPGVEAFRTAIGRADLVVSTGGLGPTADDLTRDALAEAVGRPLRRDDASLERIREMFARRNRPIAPSNERQAMFPEGSRIVFNPHGTAPGIELDAPREGRPACRVICLPGVPAEMMEMWQDSVAAALDRFIGETLGDARRVIRRRTLQTFGAGESQVEAMLPDLIRRGRRPTVGITASGSTISLRIVADGRNENECDKAIEPVVETIKQCLGSLVFGEGDDRLQDVVVRLLRKCGKTLATAEAATTGLLAEQLGAVAGSQDVFRLGMTLAALPESLSETATGLRSRYNTDFGLVIGPLPDESDASEKAKSEDGQEKPPVVRIALASTEGVLISEARLGYHPAFQRISLVKQALNQLRLTLWPSLP